ncbi:MAG: sigma-70 family RNA polymerase sigma factor [Planctomycetes bacterium]|nr:sigma-70 family RNA polymerase sigma factor [Planctomycetota bacterium]
MERFDRYLEQYRRPIFSYVVRLLHDEAAAEDIAQETFLRLFNELDRIRDETASAWLYRVARNLVTDYLRKKRPVTFTVLRGQNAGNGGEDDDRPGLEFGSKDLGPEKQSYQTELRKHIDDALNAMSEKFRDVIVLIDMQKLTHEEAAKVLGCSVKTVSARLARAREFFTRRLSKYLSINLG